MNSHNPEGHGTGAAVRRTLYRGQLCAVKSFNSTEASLKQIQKEILIHKSVNHRFIVKYINDFERGEKKYLVMELVEYNLRHLVIPGMGIDARVAHMMFVQLVEGIKYLHSLGICHRDIKPDNILVKKDGNIRICDFGHSTVFRFGKEQRRLKGQAGTPEFMAPEVHRGEYDGVFADIFSMGVTLLNILTGMLPWSHATTRDEKYRAYKSMRYHCYEPFSRVRETTLRLIESMLREETYRIGIEEIERSSWFEQKNTLLNEQKECVDQTFLSNAEEKTVNLHYTQPEMMNTKRCFLNASQPVQMPNLPAVHRFYIAAGVEASLLMLQEVLQNMMVNFQMCSNTMLFSTTDTKRNKLSGEIIVQEMNGNSVVTVKRSKGDLIEFKRFLLFIDSHFVNG